MFKSFLSYRINLDEVQAYYAMPEHYMDEHLIIFYLRHRKSGIEVRYSIKDESRQFKEDSEYLDSYFEINKV